MKKQRQEKKNVGKRAGTTLSGVSIVVVNHNGKTLLGPCLDSLLRLDYPQKQIEIIVVDNCSTDDSRVFLREKYPRVELIENDVNNYCKANNLGIGKSRGEFVVLLNNDIEVETGWLGELLEVMTTDRKIGAAGGKTLLPDGRIQGTGHREYPDFYWGDRGCREEDKGQYDRTEEIESLSHGAILYRRECLASVGQLDEDFGMYLEDVDMSLRLRKKGWKLMYTAKAVARHPLHGTAGEDLVNSQIERNRLLLVAKHYPRELAGALYGKGYFSGGGSVSASCSMHTILPEVVAKLLKHHDPGLLRELLPDILYSFQRVLGLEKKELLEQIDNRRQEWKTLLEAKASEHSSLEQVLQAVRRELAEKDASLAKMSEETREREKELREGREELKRERALRNEKERELVREGEFREAKERESDELGNALRLREEELAWYPPELGDARGELLRLHRSWGYTLCDFLKGWRLDEKETRIRKEAARKVLLIKPYRVPVDEVELAMEECRGEDPGVRITLLANLSPDHYRKLWRRESIDERMLYRPDLRKLSGIELLRLLFKLPRLRYDEAVVLVGTAPYRGHERARWLANMSGAREIASYSSRKGKITEKRPKQLKSFFLLLLAPLRALGLWGTLLGFVVFVVSTVKIRRATRRLRKSDKKLT